MMEGRVLTETPDRMMGSYPYTVHFSPKARGRASPENRQ